ncbi:MAG: asparagine synthetase B [Bacteroidota bacterium]|nr:asparagine synthetase B [Bacteroidota bacterium]MEC7526614.1 asparagine synthetase B [Bacteroidota bacterium]MEC8004628.1 asparagine synthetase B [Bacteroidota bacterium]MEC8605695.1 asparagine synthetase B [Bacteroidota bacterium]MEE3097338.1 asparagine synthetase B [Bacteroidota bacterium]
MKRLITILFLVVFVTTNIFATRILIPMDEESQRNHLKAYGIAYWILQNEIEVEWLLNYRGGSFLVTNYNSIQEECTIRGVTYELITDAKVNAIKTEISDPEVNMEVVKLEKAPKIAVYTPQGKQPWDDAVTLVLTYAEIPYDEIYDKEVVENQLFKYEWLHLHHEDFTGQYGKFYRNYKNAPWYKKQQSDSEQRALSLGFEKVSHLKLQVSKNIKEFVAGGGFLFTMCSGTDSYDIALSAENTDICEHMFDGDKADPQAQSKLNYNNTLAFKNFKLKMNPLEYEFSDIDGTTLHRIPETQDLFTLFEFSAKWDIVPTLLCQNHTNVIKGFMGQTTDFKTSLIKSDVLIMGESKALKTARYIHGEFGKGQWTFYGGHDPEDYRHFVNDPPTDLNLYPNSPGYRLILNNILFPAAKKKKQKT